MSTDFKAKNLTLYTTEVDIRKKLRRLSAGPDEIPDEDIRNAILQADGIIASQLSAKYDEDSFNRTEGAWARIFKPPMYDGDTAVCATGAGILGVTLGEDVITEYWKITFTSATAFTVQSSVSGQTGSGSTDTDFSIGTDITIPSDAWNGAFETGNIIYLVTYQQYPIISLISTLLAASILADELLVLAQPGESKIAKNFYTVAMDLLKKLAIPNEKGGMRLDTYAAADLSPRSQPYDIDSLGRDLSKYLDEDSDGYEGEYGGLSDSGWDVW